APQLNVALPALLNLKKQRGHRLRRPPKSGQGLLTFCRVRSYGILQLPPHDAGRAGHGRWRCARGGPPSRGAHFRDAWQLQRDGARLACGAPQSACDVPLRPLTWQWLLCARKGPREPTKRRFYNRRMSDEPFGQVSIAAHRWVKRRSLPRVAAELYGF